MKYKLGETVLLLNIEYKPAGLAVIVAFNSETHQYEVEYQYIGSKEKERIWVPQERLTFPSDIEFKLT